MSSLPAHIQCDVDDCPNCGGSLRYDMPNYQPGTILDPFGGSGTTAVAARRHGRHAILVELNAEYAEQARKRVGEWWKKPVRTPEADPAQTSLLG